VIIALDVEDKVKALDVIEQLRNNIGFYKVGLELYLAEGRKIVKIIKSLDKKVFLDLKLFDTPNTVYKATLRALELKPDLFSVHCLGGDEMLQSVVKAKAESGVETKLLGVTLLTSMEADDLAMGDESSFVKEMTERALNAGFDGVVCSPKDVQLLRSKFGDGFLAVCPGIRLEKTADDQKRVGNPKQALNDGANYLVIGRPVLQACDKVKAVENIRKTIL